MTVGQNILKHRGRGSLSQSELGERSGLSQAEISRIEKDKSDPSRSLVNIARALNCRVADLDPRYDVGSEPRSGSLPLVPIINWENLAATTSDNFNAYDHMQISIVRSEGHIATTIPDDSADRIAAQGSTILVDLNDSQLQPEAPYVFIHEGSPLIASYRHLPDRMQPLTTNPIFETQFMSKGTRVLGRIRLVVRSLP